MKALITGASSGIGQATARVFAEKGCSLVLIARRSDRLEALKSELLPKHPSLSIHTFACDLTNKDFLASFAKEQAEILSDVTVLINSAGLALGTDKIQNSDPSTWQIMLDTNVLALLQVTHSVLPHMIKNNNGHIFNLGSVAGRWTYPGGSVYCATKSAVKSITEGLRMDLMGTAIRVTNIEPGMVETGFSEVRLNDTQKAKAVYQGMTPLTAEDIAQSIWWCHALPAHVNIQELTIFPTQQAGVGYVHRNSNHI